MRQVQIIGAGFSGLILARALSREGFSVTVYEKNARAGGLIETKQTPWGLVETAANAFLNTPAVETLFRELDLPLVSAMSESKARYIYRDGKPRRWPLGVGATFRVVRFFLRYLFLRKSVVPRTIESIDEWGTRVFGHEVTEYLLKPALQGVYAGDAAKLSARLILKPLFLKQKPSRAKIRGSVTAPEGMGQVIQRLQESLEKKGVTFRFRTHAPKPSPEVITVYCTSAKEASVLLEKTAPELALKLSRVEMLPLVTATLFFDLDSRIRPGFGTLFPPREGFHALGVLSNHSIFPGRSEKISETWILGGALQPGAASWLENEILEKIREDRKRLRGYDEKPLGSLVTRWNPAIPHYTTKLERLLEGENFERFDSGIYCFGNYLGALGLAKLVERADRLAKRIRNSEEKKHVS